MQRAYVDESEPGGGRDHTAYVMAAVVLNDARRAPARDAILRATPSRMRKLHWYEGTTVQRLRWVDLLLHAVATVVIRYEGAPARAERRRRRCIERLVWELEQRGVRHLILESRGDRRDDNDASMIEALRSRGVGRGIRYEHVRGDAEPLLALADVACGTVVLGLETSKGDVTIVAVT